MKTVSLAMLFAFTLCFVWVVRGTVYIMCILSNIIPKHNRIELQCRQMSFTSFANSARHRLISHIFHNNCANYSDFTVGTPGQRRGKQNLSPVNNNKNNNKIWRNETATPKPFESDWPKPFRSDSWAKIIPRSKNRNLRQRASFVRARASSIRREQKAKGKSYFFFSKLPVDYWLASDHRPRSFSSLHFFAGSYHRPRSLARIGWTVRLWLINFPLLLSAQYCRDLLYTAKGGTETKQNRFALERGARRVSRNYDVYEFLLKTTFRE